MEEKCVVLVLSRAIKWASQVVTVVNTCLLMQEINRCGFDPWVGKDPLEEGMATHSSILAWRVPWTEEPGRLLFIGSQKSQT